MAQAAQAGIGHNKPPALADQLKEKYADTLYKRLKAWKAKIARVKDLQPTSATDCEKLEEVFAEGRDLANDADSFRATEKEPYLTIEREIDGLFNGDFRDTIGADRKKPGVAVELLNRALEWRHAEDQRAKAAAARAAEAAQREADRLAEKAKGQEERGKVREADVTYAQADALDDRATALQAQATSDEPVRARTSGGRAVSVSTKRVCSAVVRDELDLEKLRPYLKPADLVAAVNAGIKNGAFEAGLKGAVIGTEIGGRVR